MEQEAARTLGALLSEARKRRGLTQQALADQVGMRRGTLANIEAGAIKQPGAISKLAEVLEIPAEELQRAQEHTRTGMEPALPVDRAELTTQPFPAMSDQVILAALRHIAQLPTPEARQTALRKLPLEVLEMLRAVAHDVLALF